MQIARNANPALTSRTDFGTSLYCTQFRGRQKSNATRFEHLRPAEVLTKWVS